MVLLMNVENIMEKYATNEKSLRRKRSKKKLLVTIRKKSLEMMTDNEEIRLRYFYHSRDISKTRYVEQNSE